MHRGGERQEWIQNSENFFTFVMSCINKSLWNGGSLLKKLFLSKGGPKDQVARRKGQVHAVLLQNTVGTVGYTIVNVLLKFTNVFLTYLFT